MPNRYALGHLSRAPRPLTRFLADRLKEQVRHLDATLARLDDAAADPEAVHDVRVTSRRLRGALAALPPARRGNKKRKRIEAGLRELRTALGGAREAEVGIELLRSMHSELSPGEKVAAGAVCALLAHRRADFEAGLPETIRRLDVARLSRRCHATVRRLEQEAEAPRPAEHDSRETPRRPPHHPVGAPALPGEATDLPSLTRLGHAAVNGRRVRLLALPREPLEALDDAALHRFRIEAKKLRYTMEFFAPLYPERIETRLRKLKEIQDCLGALHDLADIKALFESMAEAAAAQGQDEAGAELRALAGRVEKRRRESFAPFPALHAAVAHPGFVPAPLAPPRSEHSRTVPDPGEKPAKMDQPPERISGGQDEATPPAAGQPAPPGPPIPAEQEDAPVQPRARARPGNGRSRLRLVRKASRAKRSG